MSDEPSEEELKEMLEKAKEIAEKKREEQASKVGKLNVGDTSEIENVLEKKLSEQQE
ncbi:MAG: hypothetical protein ACTSRP_11400 [Candidatus Helarchaeota archaeon]